MTKIDSKKDVKTDAKLKGKATDDKTEVTAPSGISIRVDRTKYQASRSAAGGKSLNNGDVVALALDGLTLEEVQSLADKLIKDNDFADRYAKLNVGMQRMNIGNRLRGWINKDEANPAKFDKAADPITKAAAKRQDTAQKERDVKAKAAAKAKAEAEKKAA